MKTKLSQAIAAAALMGAATAATAVEVNHDGLGQALLFPLYTVEANNQTTIHLTNTTADFKAVKVRFRRATDSADVLDFNLYLSPQDQWTGVVTLGEDDEGNEVPVLISHDNSCVSADPKREYLKVGMPFGVEGDATKGHIEVIEMANWTRAEARAALVQTRIASVDVDGNPVRNRAAGGNTVNVEDAVEHIVAASGPEKDQRVPGNCQAIHDSWNPWHKSDNPKGGLWAEKYAASIVVDPITGNIQYTDNSFNDEDMGFKPTGGLYGNAYVLNVDDAWAAGHTPTALEDLYLDERANIVNGRVDVDATGQIVTTGELNTGNNHHRPQLGLADLQGPEADFRITVMQNPESVNWPEATIRGKVEELRGRMNQWNYGMDLASNIADPLRATNLYSDYVMGSGIDAGTELAVTFPLKYAGFPTRGSTVAIDAEFYDREEARFEPAPDHWQWSPWVPGEEVEKPALPHETNLIKLVHADSEDEERHDLGEPNGTIESNFEAGWVNISFDVEQLTIDLDELEKQRKALEKVVGAKVDIMEFAAVSLGLEDNNGLQWYQEFERFCLPQSGPNAGEGVYDEGECTITINDNAQPVIGFSNIVLKNTEAKPGVNNTYSITHELKYQRPVAP